MAQETGKAESCSETTVEATNKKTRQRSMKENITLTFQRQGSSDYIINMQ